MELNIAYIFYSKCELQTRLDQGMLATSSAKYVLFGLVSFKTEREHKFREVSESSVRFLHIHET